MVFKKIWSPFTAAGVQYEIRGNIDLINSYDIHPDYYNEKSFTEKLNKVSERVSDGALHEFIFQKIIFSFHKLLDQISKSFLFMITSEYWKYLKKMYSEWGNCWKV